MEEDLVLFFSEMLVNGMVDGESLDSVDVFDELEAHGASYSSIPKLKVMIHEKLVEAGSTESVSAMNQNSRDVGLNIVVVFAQLADVFVN